MKLGGAFCDPLIPLHSLLATEVLLALVGADVAAGLYHYLIRGDYVLQRMLPRRRVDQQTAFSLPHFNSMLLRQNQWAAFGRVRRSATLYGKRP